MHASLGTGTAYRTYTDGPPALLMLRYPNTVQSQSGRLYVQYDLRTVLITSKKKYQYITAVLVHKTSSVGVGCYSSTEYYCCTALLFVLYK